MNADNTNDFTDDPKLAATGRRVAELSRPSAPSDLVSRTLAAVLAQVPLRRTPWILRPITSPWVRVGVAAALMLSLVPLSDLDTAEMLGSKIESKVVGTSVVNHVENLLDGVLDRVNHDDYSQSELDQLFGAPTGSVLRGKPRLVKLVRGHSRV